MSKNVIFCYSGTGNCLDIAKNIARGLGDTDIIMMRSEPSVKDVQQAETVGFVFPCYGGGAPADFLKFAKDLLVSRRSFNYAVSCSASYAGTGLYELNKIVTLDYWKTVTHHCSCIWLFPHDLMLPRLPLDKAQERSEKLAAEIAEDVRARRKVTKKPPHNLLNAAENKGFGSIGSKKAESFKVSDKCVGCGTCVQLCPRGNIQLSAGKAVIGTDCAGCLGCLQFCPEGAISMGTITDKREHYHNPKVKAADLMESVIHID
ncbi:MAG: EFR1 family ferrodoxin [Synergistes sp.]|nr:EFR1 family ferrodoxin [Synergistes sp.]